MVKWILAAIVFFGLWYYSQAQAQTPCISNEKLSRHMLEVYQERLVAEGMDKAGRLVQVYANEFGNWTLIIRFAEKSCALAYGDGWRTIRLQGTRT